MNVEHTVEDDYTKTQYKNDNISITFYKDEDVERITINGKKLDAAQVLLDHANIEAAPPIGSDYLVAKEVQPTSVIQIAEALSKSIEREQGRTDFNVISQAELRAITNHQIDTGALSPKELGYANTQNITPESSQKTYTDVNLENLPGSPINIAQDRGEKTDLLLKDRESTTAVLAALKKSGVETQEFADDNTLRANGNIADVIKSLKEQQIIPQAVGEEVAASNKPSYVEREATKSKDSSASLQI